MKKICRIISVAMAVVLSLSVFTVSAAAEGEARYELPFEANAKSYILVSLDTDENIYDEL